MIGAELIVQNLIKHNVDIAFGYIGGSVLDLFDRLSQHKDKIKLYTSACEQGACHSADGYARVSGKVGVVIATSGPGATNLVTGIATAFMDSVPLVVITGNVASSLIGKDSFQEIDIIGVTMPITKHNFLVKDILMLENILDEAFDIAVSGRPGPVLVDIPKDIFSEKFLNIHRGGDTICGLNNLNEAAYDLNSLNGKGAGSDENNSGCKKGVLCGYEKNARCGKGKTHCAISEKDLADAEELIKNADKPFIYVGGGVVKADAGEEIVTLAERINAPIGASLMGLSAVPNDHPNYLGLIGMHGLFGSSKIMSEADLIIAVGTRFSDRATGNKEKFYKNRKILHIDIDPSEIGKNIPAYFSLVGDAKAILMRLNNVVEEKSCTEWKARFAAIKEENRYSLESAPELTPRFIIEKLQKYTTKSTVIATDVGQHQIWTAQYYKFYKSKTFLTAGGLGTMGYGLGAAIGACAFVKEKTVLVTGDGSFLMNMNELATAVTYKLPLVVIVLNNNALGMVKQWQEIFKKGRIFETQPQRQINFAALADAMGAKGYRIDKAEDAEGIFKRAFEAKSPVVIEVIISPQEKVLPIIPPEKGLEDIILRG